MYIHHFVLAVSNSQNKCYVNLSFCIASSDSPSYVASNAGQFVQSTIDSQGVIQCSGAAVKDTKIIIANSITIYQGSQFRVNGITVSGISSYIDVSGSVLSIGNANWEYSEGMGHSF